MSELATPSLEELRAKVQADPFDKESIVQLARMLNRETHLAATSGDLSRAESLANELYELKESRSDVPEALEWYIASQSNEIARMTLPDDLSQMWEVLHELQGIQSSGGGTQTIAERYGVALGNAYTKGGKADPETVAFIRSEFVNLIETYEESTPLAEGLAVVLCNEHARLRNKGNDDAAAATSEEFGQLYSRFPESEAMASFANRITANDLAMASRRGESVDASQALIELREICSRDGAPVTEFESLALLLGNLYVTQGKASLGEEGEARINELRDLFAAKPEQKIAVHLVKVLAHKASLQSKSGSLATDTLLLPELRDLTARFPDAHLFAEKTAAVLNLTHGIARKGGDWAAAVSNLAELSAFVGRLPASASIRSSYVICLYNAHHQSRKEPELGAPATHVANLEALYSRNPGDGKVGDYLAQALFNSVVDEPDGPGAPDCMDRLRELMYAHEKRPMPRQMLCRALTVQGTVALKENQGSLAASILSDLRAVAAKFPDDSVVQHALASEIVKHYKTGKESEIESGARKALRLELCAMTEVRRSGKDVLDAYAELIYQAFYNAAVGGDTDLANRMAHELWSYRRSHPDSEFIAHNCLLAIQWRHKISVKAGQVEQSDSLVDEVQTIAEKHPQKGARFLAEELARSLNLAINYADDKKVVSRLEELHVLHGQHSDDPIVVGRFAYALATAAAFAWYRFDVRLSARLMRRFDALYGVTPYNDELVKQLADYRRGVTKWSFIWAWRALLVDRKFQAVFFLVVIGVLYILKINLRGH